MQRFYKYMKSWEESLDDEVCIGGKIEPVRLVVARWRGKQGAGVEVYLV